MPSEIANLYNRVPSNQNLLRLTRESPVEAAQVVNSVQAAVVNDPLAPESARQDVQSVAAAAGTDGFEAAVANSELFQGTFPSSETATSMAELLPAVRPAVELGWTASAARPALSAYTGIPRAREGGGFELAMGEGRVLELLDGTQGGAPNQIPFGFPAGWLEGFTHDGNLPMTVAGVLNEGGTAIIVEAFVPGTKLDARDFVTGRVEVRLNGNTVYNRPNSLDDFNNRVQNAEISIVSTRARVNVTDPELRRAFSLLTRLGVIITERPSQTPEGQWVYDRPVGDFYALGGRFRSGEKTQTDGSVSVPSEYSYSEFIGPTVITGGSGVAGRVDASNMNRNLILGHFEIGADEAGTPRIQQVTGSYITTGLQANLSYANGPADPLRNILASSEVFDVIEGSGRTVPEAT